MGFHIRKLKIFYLKDYILIIATWAQWGFQDSVSAPITEFTFFHDMTLMWLGTITIMVFWVITVSLISPFIATSVLEGQAIETIWTLVPGLILANIAAPSLSLLYEIDEGFFADTTIKAVGHQWYWTYDLQDSTFEEKYERSLEELDCYLFKSKIPGVNRLLDTEWPQIPLIYDRPYRILVTSADVLHSWTVPRLGVKADASPGRLNQIFFSSDRVGVFYGQCSEICGANHRFIPISLQFLIIPNP